VGAGKEGKMKLYQYAVILHPTEDEKKAGVVSKVIVDVTTVLAPNDNGAAMLAGRAIPEEYLAKIDRIEVAVRPF